MRERFYGAEQSVKAARPPLGSVLFDLIALGPMLGLVQLKERSLLKTSPGIGILSTLVQIEKTLFLTMCWVSIHIHI